MKKSVLKGAWLLLLSLWSCEPAKPHSLYLPDLSHEDQRLLLDSKVQDLDEGLAPDRGDFLLLERALDGDLSNLDGDLGASDGDLAASDGDLAALDGDLLSLDAEPPDAPPSAFKILSSRSDAWLLWRKGAEIFAAEATGEELGPILALGAADELVAERTSGGRPYVILPTEEGLKLRELGSDLEQPLQLYPPILSANRSEQIIFLGRSGVEPEAPLAWQILESGQLGTLQIDPQGLSMPVQILPALEQWVLLYEDGLCASLGAGRLTVEPWRCHARPGSRAVGDLQQILNVGLQEGKLLVWSALPGSAEGPEQENPFIPPVILAEGVEQLNWLPPLREGLALEIGEELWIIQEDGSLHLPLTEPPLGLIYERRRAQLVFWDAEAAQPSIREVEAEAGPDLPLALPRDPDCSHNLAPEDCSAQDMDCNTVEKGGLCCGKSSPSLQANLPQGQLPQGPGFAAVSDLGILIFQGSTGPTGESVRLQRHGFGQDSGAELLLTAEWPGVLKVKEFDNDTSILVALGERRPDLNPEADPEEVLLFFAPTEERPEATISPSPCEQVLALRLLNLEGRARIFCSDRAVDLEPGGAELELPYPEGAALDWARRYAGGDPLQLLVSRGARLELWRDGDSFEQLPLPEALAALSPEEFQLPFQMPVAEGGLMARLNEGLLEVYESGAWRSSPASSWPLEAQISETQPWALSLGYFESPEERDERESLGIFVHDLRPDALHWGRELPGQSNLQARSYQGLLKIHGSSEQLPDWIRFLGLTDVGTAEISLLGYDLECFEIALESEEPEEGG